MSREDLEFSIAQLADGTLPAEERAALEEAIAGDPEAAALLAEFRALDAALKATAMPVVDWERFARSTSDLVSRHADAVISEELEASIAQYADGTLPEAERAAVEAALEQNAAARLMLADYQAVDQALKETSVPSIQWDRLSQEISQAVARQANGVLAEDVEFAVAQYADGTLAPEQYVDVEARLAEDPAAREVLAGYRQIDALVKSTSMPAVNWDRLADHLSQEIAAKSDAVEEQQASRFRISTWLRAPVWMAAAASVLIGIGLSAWLMQHGKTTTPIGPAPTGPGYARVEGPTVEKPTGNAVGEITFGPPATFAEMTEDDLVSRPSRTIVSGGAVAERTSGFLPN